MMGLANEVDGAGERAREAGVPEDTWLLAVVMA